MAQNFYSILTTVGKARMANAYALGTNINLTTLAVGDSSGSYYEPTESQSALKNQVWTGNINSINVDPENPNWIVISTVIPTTDGGFTIREAGIFDDVGNMIAIGKYPETYKPVLSEGSSKDLTINMILEISNTSTVTLKVDPTVVLATKKDVQTLDGKITTLNNTVTAHSNENATFISNYNSKNDDIQFLNVRGVRYNG
ncbi:MAG: phage tail protein [Clostridiaceae bacterium]